MSPRNRLSPIERLGFLTTTSRHKCRIKKVGVKTLSSDLVYASRLEELEPRRLFSTYTVDTLVDESDGIGVGNVSLRDAINEANANVGVDTILFDTLLFSGGGTITLGGSELSVTDSVVILNENTTSVTVDANDASRVFNIAASTVSIDNLVITGGSANDGAGINVASSSTVTISHTVITDNHAGDDGAGIKVTNGRLNLSNVTVSLNTNSGGGSSADGAGIHASSSVLVIDESEILQNAALDDGGGIYMSNSTLTMTNSLVSGNSTSISSGEGAGLGVFNSSSTATIRYSTISDNTAGGEGAGLFVRDARATVTNTTISGNVANREGGGVRLRTGGSITLTNVTITGNDALLGGGIHRDAGSFFARNTLIAGNIANSLNDISGVVIGTNVLVGDHLSASGMVDGVNGNIIGDGGTAALAIADILDTNLTDNGGPTLTHALVNGSRALHAGDNALAAGLVTDQRGGTFERIYGFVDIGAFEGQTLMVDTISDNDDGDYSLGNLSLREAILMANASVGTTETITFDSSVFSGGDDTITLSLGQLAISDDVVISSTTGNEVIVDANDSSRVFEITSSTVTMSHMVLTGGQVVGNGGAINHQSGALTLDQVSIQENEAAYGGGIYLDGVTATISMSTIIDNNATDQDGGGLMATNGSVVSIVDSTISMNYAADDGGGIQMIGGALTVTNSLVSQNTAEEDGGGLDLDGSATVTVTLSTITGNATVSEDGAGIKVAEGTALELVNSTVTLNNSGDDGGGIQVDAAYLSVTDSLITGNTADEDGAGVDVDGGTVVITGSTISGNTSSYSGAGLYAYEASVIVTKSTIAGNTATISGGGVSASYDTVMTILSSTVSGNIASYGGGIEIFGGGIGADEGAYYTTVTIVNSTVSGNTGSAQGGGVITRYAYLDILNSTITGNVSAQGGGVRSALGSYVTLLNSIIAGNTATTDNDISGTVETSASYNNLIGDHTSSGGLSDATGGNIVGDSGTATLAIGDILDTTLANNGGLTQTHALVIGSRAINSGDNSLLPWDDFDLNGNLNTAEPLPHDQRGLPRVYDVTLDIGAYELQNVAPVDLSLDSDNVLENSADDTLVGTITVSDPNPSDTHTFSLINNAGGRFDIDANTGVVTVEDGSLLDHELNGSHVITVEATDSGTLSFSKDVTITIEDVNEAPTDLAIDNDSVLENSADDTEVGTVTVSDVDDGDTHTFSLINNAGERFDIDANSGVVTVEDGSLLDHELNGSHVITVEATDSGTLSFSKDVTITIEDVNEAPTDLDLAPSTVPENSADDTEVGTVTVSDVDNGDTHTFSLTDDAGGRFDIDANTGIVTVEDGSLLDHELNGSHVITVEATDSGTLSFSKDVTITIEDVNEAPTDLDLAPSTVPENSADDTEVGTVTVSDVDNGDTHTFSLTDDAGGRFDIDANTGVVTVEDGSLLDHELNGSHVITVEATDSGTLSFSKDVTITIEDVNEAPIDLDLAPSTVPENSADDTEVGTVTVSDVDDGDTHTFSLTDDAGGRFDIDANTGVVTVEDGSLLDHELNGSHVITVEATDSGTLSFSKEVTITIEDVNEAPIDLDLAPGTVPENSADDTEVGTVTVSDVDDGDTHTFSLTDDAGGRFDIDANTGVVTVEDGSLLDHELNGSHVITVEATDSGTLSFSKDVAITIEDVNEAPTDLAIDNDSVPENSADDTEVGTVTVSDVDDGDTHTFSLTDDAGGRFDIDANTGVVTVEDGSLLDHELNGSHVITVEATDSGTLSFSKDVTITIEDVNEAPIDLDLAPSTVPENSADDTEVGTVTVSDVDDGDTHTFSLTDDAGGRFDIDANTGVVTVEDGSLLDHELNGSHVITVEATDSGTLSFSKEVTITIEDVNEAPIDLDLAPSTVPENSADDTEVGTVTVSDVDDGDTHTFSLTDDAGGRFDIDANTGVVTVEDGSLLDHELNGSHVITVEATDSGTLSFSKDVAITIEDVNEAPTDLAIDNDSVPENSADDTEVGTVTVSDVDNGDTHTFSLTDDAGGRFDIDANTGVVTVEDGSLLDHELNGSHVITVEATDSGTLSFSKDVTITIEDVNEAPTDLSIDNDIILDNVSDGDSVGTISVSDPDGVPPDSHTFVLTDTAGGRFAIDLNTGLVTVVDGDLIDFNVDPSHDITIQVTDRGGLSFSKSITIIVTLANAAPTDITLDNDEVNEGDVDGTLIGTVAAVDDPGETHTYVLTDDAGGRFEIDANSGEITLLDRSLIDFDTNASHDITVRATDSASNTFDKTFTINVNHASGYLIPIHMRHGMRVGQRLNGVMKIKITNDSGVDFVRSGDLNIKLVARPTDGSPEVVLSQRSLNTGWRNGATREWYFNVNYTGLSVGEYQLVGVVCYDNIATLTDVDLFANENRRGEPFILRVGATHFRDLVGRVQIANSSNRVVRAGGVQSATLLVNVENHGSFGLGPRLIDLAVYAEDSLGNRLADPVATATGVRLAFIRTTGRMPVWLSAKFPAGVTPGNYHFVVDVDSSNAISESNPSGTGESNNDDNISLGTVRVLRGEIDLSGSVTDAKGVPTYSSGGPISDTRTFTLVNNGNVSTPADATADLVMSIFDGSDTLVRTQTIQNVAMASVLPGKKRIVNALLSQTPLAADNYRVEVDIQPDNFLDSVPGNNTFEFFFDVV